MKGKSYRFRIGIMLTIIASCILCACGTKEEEKIVIEPMEKEEVASCTFDFLGGKDVMPIGGYYGPQPSELSIDGTAVPDYINEEIFKAIAESGINLIEHTYTNYDKAPEMAKKLLELGEKYNIGIAVTDQFKDYTKATVSQYGERIANYSDYASFCGMYIVDEPGNDTYFSTNGRPISAYGNVFSNLDELGIWGYANLYPLYERDKRDVYEDYVNEFLKTCKVKNLQWDFYVNSKGHDRLDYFYNMSVIREKAEEYNIPFWPYIQAGAQWGSSAMETDGYYPDEGEFDWNVNTCLAYGAKGLGYFPVIQPIQYSYAMDETYDFERSGMIGAWGNLNRWWYYAKDINKHIAAIDEVLMNSVNKGIIVTSKQAKSDTKDSKFILEGKSWRELTDVTGDAMIGCFNYQGKSAFYVVNYDSEYAQEITLQWYDDCQFRVVQNAETSRLEGDSVTLTMEAGEGVLVVME